MTPLAVSPGEGLPLRDHAANHDLDSGGGRGGPLQIRSSFSAVPFYFPDGCSYQSALARIGGLLSFLFKR